MCYVFCPEIGYGDDEEGWDVCALRYVSDKAEKERRAFVHVRRRFIDNSCVGGHSAATNVLRTVREKRRLANRYVHTGRATLLTPRVVGEKSQCSPRNCASRIGEAANDVYVVLLSLLQQHTFSNTKGAQWRLDTLAGPKDGTR